MYCKLQLLMQPEGIHTCLCPLRRLEFFLLRFLKMSTLAS